MEQICSINFSGLSGILGIIAFGSFGIAFLMEYTLIQDIKFSYNDLYCEILGVMKGGYQRNSLGPVTAIAYASFRSAIKNSTSGPLVEYKMKNNIERLSLLLSILFLITSFVFMAC